MSECLYGHDTTVVFVYAHQGSGGLDNVNCCTYVKFPIIALVLNFADLHEVVLGLRIAGLYPAGRSRRLD